MTPSLPVRNSKTEIDKVSQRQQGTVNLAKLIPTLFVLTFALVVPPASRAQIVTDATNPVVDIIPITAAEPGCLGGIVSSPNGKTVYVSDTENSSIAVINAARNELTSLIATTNPPTGIAISPDGNTLYATDSSDQLEVVSVGAHQTLFTIPVGNSPQIPGVSPDGSMIYVPNTSDGTVTAVDYDDLTYSVINLGGAPTQAVFNSDSSEAYVSNEQSKFVSVINTSTNAVKTIPTPTITVGLAIKGTTLYATGINAIYVIDTANGKVTATIPVSTPASALLGLPALTLNGSFLYAPIVVSGGGTIPGQTVVVVNTTTKKIEGQPIEVGAVPLQIVTAAGGKYGYVACSSGGIVNVIKLLP